MTATMLLASIAFAGAGVYAQAGIDRASDRRVWRFICVPGNLFAAATLGVALATAWPSPAIRSAAVGAIVAFVAIEAIVVALLRSREQQIESDHMPIAIGVNAAMAMAAYLILSR